MEIHAVFAKNSGWDTAKKMFEEELLNPLRINKKNFWQSLKIEEIMGNSFI